MIQGAYNKSLESLKTEQVRRLFECRCCKGLVYAKAESSLPACPHCQHDDYRILAEPVVSTAFAGKWLAACSFLEPYYADASHY